MSLPTIEPLPDETENLPPARKRRQRRMIVPPEASERAGLLSELVRKAVPSVDFFLFSLLCGVVLGLALLFDSPALVLLGVLVAPFMAPAVGISLGTVTGSIGFILQSLGSLGIGSLIVFLCGAGAGLLVPQLPEQGTLYSAFFSQFHWTSMAVLVFGSVLTALSLVRAPDHQPTVPSLAIAYSLYVPMAAAGFGLSSDIGAGWPGGVLLFFSHLLWAALLITLVLALLGLRPVNASGYVLGGGYLAVGVLMLLLINPPSLDIVSSGSVTATLAQSASEEVTPSPAQTTAPAFSATASATRNPTVTPSLTATQPPTETPTLTPVPTPVFAFITANEGGGALIREEPNFDATVVQSILNGALVEVLPDTVTENGSLWLHIRTDKDVEN